jgi:hypothetical protein
MAGSPSGQLKRDPPSVFLFFGPGLGSVAHDYAGSLADSNYAPFPDPLAREGARRASATVSASRRGVGRAPELVLRARQRRASIISPLAQGAEAPAEPGEPQREHAPCVPASDAAPMIEGPRVQSQSLHEGGGSARSPTSSWQWCWRPRGRSSSLRASSAPGGGATCRFGLVLGLVEEGDELVVAGVVAMVSAVREHDARRAAEVGHLGVEALELGRAVGARLAG